jgi:hypothetical protein
LTKRGYKIPLEELLALLKAGGYQLSIEQILEIQSTLLSTPLSQLPTRELKFIITPVIAKNEEDQQDIYRIVDAYVADKTRQTITSRNRFSLWLYMHRRMVLLLKWLGLFFLVATGIMVYVLTRDEGKHPTIVNPQPAPTTQQADTSKATNPAPAINPNLPGSHPSINKGEVEIIATTRAHGHIIPNQQNNKLQVSLLFGFLLGAILFHLIFYERKRRLEQEKRKRREESIFTDPTKEEKKIPSAGYEEIESFQPISVQFQEKNYLIPRPAAFQKIKNYLRKPAPVGLPELDIKRTITASVRSAGFASLVYTNEYVDRKYIIISKHASAGSHITHFLQYVAGLLGTALTPVHRYTYVTDITELQDSNDNTFYFKDLRHHFAGHHLVIIDDCHSFFNAHDQLLRDDVDNILREWPSKSIITPVALPGWGNRETQLHNNGFRIVPADLQAIELLSSAIAEDTPITKEKIAKRLRDGYAVSPAHFQSADTLKVWLNNEPLFQLVCALAVYPSLHWPLSLALYDALAKNNPGLPLSYEQVLKMARIPWLNARELDQPVRLQLLNQLTPETEIIARETVIRMLEEVQPLTMRGSRAFKELQTQYTINAFFLFSHDQYKYKGYAGVKDVIIPHWNKLTEWALKEHINSKGNSLLPAHQSKTHATVEEFILHEREFDKQHITLSKIAILISPAILLYIAFSIFKPALVYPEDYIDHISFNIVINKDDVCKQHITHVVTTVNGLSQTRLLDTLGNTDTIPVPDIKYNSIASIHFYAKDRSIYSSSVPATDSFFVFTTRCSGSP